MTSPVASAVQSALPPDSGIRVGVVTAIESTSAVTVNVGGGIITGMPYLASYVPAIGDNVQIIRMDATWLVIGVIGGNPGILAGGARGISTTPTAAVSAETDLSFLAFTAQTKQSHVYEILARLIVVQTVATDVFTIQFRRDTALTGTQIGLYRTSTAATTGSMSLMAVAPFEEVVNETLSVFVSVLRAAGTGTIAVTPRISGGNVQLSSYSRMIDMGLDQDIPGSGWLHP